MSKKKHSVILSFLLLLTGCNGIFDDIYDNPDDVPQTGLTYGFLSVEADSLGGRLFFNSTSYTRWTYFNLREISSDTLDFSKEITPQELELIEPTDWDVAFHRSVPKTNGGRVAETRYSSVAELSAAIAASGSLESFIARESLDFHEDEWSEEIISLDLSGMFTGDVVWLPSYYNRVLNGWLDIDISNPPPIYTMSNKAYILQLRSGECYALALVHFRNSKNVTAWLTIDFRRL